VFTRGNQNGNEHRGTWTELRALLSAKGEIVLVDEELRGAQTTLN